MYSINKTTRDVNIECKYCKQKITFTLPESILEHKEFPFPFRYIHGEPYHSVTIYLDKQLNIRSTEFGDSLTISCEILNNCGDSAELLGVPVLKTWIIGLITTINVFSTNRQEILDRVGRILGDKYSKYFQSKDIQGLTKEFQSFWKANEFGFVKNVLFKDDQVVFDILDNLEVFYLPKMHKKLCFLTQGFLKVILEKNLGKVYSIMELLCTANGDSMCRFSIRWD